MTIEITEFRCRTCGHILGEEEYKHALRKHDKDRQAIHEELRKEMANKYQEEMQQERVKHQRENQQLHEEFNRELENRTNLKAQSRIDDILLKEQEKRQQAVAEALRLRDGKWRLEEEQYQQLIGGLQKDKRKLENRLDSIPPERRGTAGERILTKDLHEAFPQDNLEEKRVGEEMPDIIQTIVTENGKRIATPILWDMKTGEIRTNDIEKAKRYKEKYNTDYCILVTQRLIEAKYTKNGIEGHIGRRDGITLLHTSIAGEMAEEIRNFVIKETRLVKNNNGRTSKQSKLFD
jgi:hypothetical protein